MQMMVLILKKCRVLVRWSWICALAMLLFAVSPAGAAIKRMNVEQLEKLIAANKGKSDRSIADKIYEVELTEQLSEARLATDAALLPGDESRKALTAVADIAIFLPLPKADEVADAAPDAATAAAIFKSGQLYAAKLIPKLPNFFATRTITRYQDVPMERVLNPQENIIYEPLHVMGFSTLTVLYRDGHEVIDAGPESKPGNNPENWNLNTEGEFGPMLLTVLADSAHGKVKWGHWEKRPEAMVAVFDYKVPQRFSHYKVNEPWVDHDTTVMPAYHGEIAVNPTDGTILRLTMIAEMKPEELVTTANMLVDYGEVEIGGKKFICPVKSVALSLVHMERKVEIDSVGIGWEHETRSTLGPAQTRVNDMKFSEYHQFRAESVVVGAEEGPK